VVNVTALTKQCTQRRVSACKLLVSRLRAKCKHQHSRRGSLQTQPLHKQKVQPSSTNIRTFDPLHPLAQSGPLHDFPHCRLRGRRGVVGESSETTQCVVEQQPQKGAHCKVNGVDCWCVGSQRNANINTVAEDPCRLDLGKATA
jgi:hypothetical protein